MFKKISRKTEELLVEWLGTLVSDEEMKQVNTKNIMKFMPSTDTHTALKYGVQCIPFTPKWMRKQLKKIYKNNPNLDLDTITLKSLEEVATDQKTVAITKNIF